VVAVKRRVAILVALASAFACAEGFAPGQRVRLAIVPVFSSPAPGVVSGGLDHLRICIERVPSGVMVIDTSVAVDSTGSVDLPLTVSLLSDPEQFEILLQGIRSSDNTVLYQGLDTVRVTAEATPPVEIPISYLGPCKAGSGCRVTVGPQVAALTQGDSLLMTVIVDSAGIPVTGVPLNLVNLDPTLVRVGATLWVVARTGTPGGSAGVVVQIPSHEDTLRLTVFPPSGSPPAPVVFAGDSTDGVVLNSGVFQVNRDGSGRFRLNDRGRFGDVYPRWSPDRRRVAFTFDQGTGRNELFVVALTGDTVASLVTDTGARRARWSPDGVHLAFECGTGFTAQEDVCVIPDVTGPITGLSRVGDGAGRVVVTDFDSSKVDGPASFAWDPTDSKRLIVVRDSLTTFGLASRLWTVGFDGQTPLPLSPAILDVGKGPLTVAGTLDVTTNGATIVFAAPDSGGSRKLYLIERDGSGLRQLTGGTGSDDRPVFSPDGRQVLFIRDSGCSVDYWRVDAQTGAETQVSAEGWCDFSSSVLGHDWSPDGKDIVLVGGEPPGGFADTRIYRIPAATTAATYLQDRRLIGRASDAGASVRDIQPSWRP
jgi:hypothetical protein